MVGLIYPSDDGMRLPTQLREVIGAEQARTARDAMSEGTGVIKSGRALKRLRKAASSTLRR